LSFFWLLLCLIKLVLTSGTQNSPVSFWALSFRLLHLPLYLYPLPLLILCMMISGVLYFSCSFSIYTYNLTFWCYCS
jgi:hypothetical protein